MNAEDFKELVKRSRAGRVEASNMELKPAQDPLHAKLDMLACMAVVMFLVFSAGLVVLMLGIKALCDRLL